MTAFRDYDAGRDLETTRRIWREVGWLDDDKPLPMEHAIDAGRARVAEVQGEAECLVINGVGTVRHLRSDLPLCAVLGVTTSRVARHQGLASRLTAWSIAHDVADGALVAALGMFEQGYYDRLGFGSGPYETRVVLDPSQLKIDPSGRVPCRLGLDDWARVHDNRVVRQRQHGACTLGSPSSTRAEMAWSKNGFGLGFEQTPGGELTHHAWFGVRDNVENGPYTVWWLAYQTAAQFRELLGLLKCLGDNIRAVRLTEPPGIQMQDFMLRPFERWAVTDRGDFDSHPRSSAWWQMRICDVPGCLARTRLPGSDQVRFNLEVHDPITHHLPEDAPWRGAGGTFVVTIGPSSGAEPGRDETLPTLRTSINAFTRLWLGVRPASGLAVSDELDAPPELLEELDAVVRLPTPHTDWDF